jgi:hypothetical protein
MISAEMLVGFTHLHHAKSVIHHHLTGSQIVKSHHDGRGLHMVTHPCHSTFLVLPYYRFQYAFQRTKGYSN